VWFHLTHRDRNNLYYVVSDVAQGFAGIAKASSLSTQCGGGFQRAGLRFSGGQKGSMVELADAKVPTKRNIGSCPSLRSGGRGQTLGPLTVKT